MQNPLGRLCFSFKNSSISFFHAPTLHWLLLTISKKHVTTKPNPSHPLLFQNDKWQFLISSAHSYMALPRILCDRPLGPPCATSAANPSQQDHPANPRPAKDGPPIQSTCIKARPVFRQTDTIITLKHEHRAEHHPQQGVV
jgi:hypothetical protein